jgi:predicted nucleic acid-binding protein
MKILFDTSVLVTAMIESHPFHPNAFTWLKRAKTREFDMFVSGHTLAELYAVLTTLPVSPRIAPGTAMRLIHDNIETGAKIVSLSPLDYRSVIKHIADLQLSGGTIYDALIAKAAQKSDVNRLLTLNIDDFRRVWPDGADRIALP